MKHNALAIISENRQIPVLAVARTREVSQLMILNQEVFFWVGCFTPFHSDDSINWDDIQCAIVQKYHLFY